MTEIREPKLMPGHIPGLPSWDELFDVVRGSMPRGMDVDGEAARNITTGVHLHMQVKLEQDRAAWRCTSCRAWPDDPTFDPESTCWRCRVCGTRLVEGVR